MTDTLPRSRRPLLAAAAVLGTLGLGAAALYGTAGPGSNSGSPACRAARDTAARLAPLARGEVAALSVAENPKPAPAASFNGRDGRPMTLADFKGKTVLVNLWATWCVPCRREMPALDKLQAELGGADFEVVAINIDTRDPEKPKAWLQDNGVTRLAYYAEPEGKLLQTLQRSGHVVGLPTTLLVGPQGCEIAVLKGPAEWASEDALKLVRAALRPSSGG